MTDLTRTRRVQEGTLLEEDRVHVMIHVPSHRFFLGTTLSRVGYFGDQIIPLLPINFLEAINHESELELHECVEEADGGGARLMSVGGPITWATPVGQYADHRTTRETSPVLTLVVRRTPRADDLPFQRRTVRRP